MLADVSMGKIIDTCSWVIQSAGKDCELLSDIIEDLKAIVNRLLYRNSTH